MAVECHCVRRPVAEELYSWEAWEGLEGSDLDAFVVVERHLPVVHRRLVFVEDLAHLVD